MALAERDLNPGYCIAFGGTNARRSECAGGDINGFESVGTPDNPEAFFSWLSRNVLEAADNGANWAVAGFPGPVAKAGESFVIGPFTNIPGLGVGKYDLNQKLAEADSAYNCLLEQGFKMAAANDGLLAAHAAASKIGEGEFETVADIILGTGVGGDVVKRDACGIYRPTGLPFEIGHIVIGESPIDTFENIYSGTAIKAATGKCAESEELAAAHPIWAKVGRGVGKLATTMSLMTGAELVVPSGGVGVGRYDDYRASLSDFMRQYAEIGSPAQRTFVPEIRRVPNELAQTFEMFGAEGVMRDLNVSVSSESPITRLVEVGSV